MNILKLETFHVEMDQQCSLPVVGGQVLMVINVLLVIIGTCGNFLTIFAVLKAPELGRKPSNFLLLSLSVADVLVTAISQPLFVAILYLKTFHEECNKVLEMVYLITAGLSGCSSVCHLAAISIDRVVSMLKPHNHRNIIRKWLKIMLFICWGMGLTFTTFNAFLLKQGKIAVVAIFFACFLVMMVCYGIILYKIRASNAIQAENLGSRDRIMERRVSGTIAIVIFLYVLCWAPLVGYNLIKPNALEYAGIRTLYLGNSSMNFVVYSLRIQAFRLAYVRLIKRLLAKMPQIVAERCCWSSNNDETTESQRTDIEMYQSTRGSKGNDEY